MGGYLTEKARKTRWWHIPVAGLSLLLVAVSIEVWIEDRDIEDFVISLLAHLTVTGLSAWPLIHVVREWWLRQVAKRVAPKLAQRRERSLPLAGLDRVLGVRQAAKKIRTLTNKGYLQLVGVDEEAGCLWLNNPEPEPETRVPEAADGEFDDVIRKIRQLNDDIADEEVSERIDRIEAVTASIFRTIKEQPDHAEAARRFMNYYLPTTLRLLETYRLMEGQSYQGENIQASRRSIEAVLDKLVSATEAQQDRLFQSDAMDVEADIRVLESMMASDGLTRTEGME